MVAKNDPKALGLLPLGHHRLQVVPHITIESPALRNPDRVVRAWKLPLPRNGNFLEVLLRAAHGRWNQPKAVSNLPTRASVAVTLACIRVARIDTAIGVCTRRGRHALAVGRELAIAGITPMAPLQAIARRARRVCSGS
jgi:hypothetical protein